MTTFTRFDLPAFLTEALERMNITIPTPIQAKAIPAGLEGHDILGSAQTGTGKTMAYLIPLIANLMKTDRSTALIMAPTRELAAQIQEAARRLLGKKAETALLIGGDSMSKQLFALRKKPRIIVGTPGRINDHLTRNSLKLNEARFLVLDETDRMLDMGFADVLKKIVDHLPEERQTFMFSATMPPSIKTLSMSYLNNPKQIAIGSTTQPVVKIKQEMFQTSSNDKYPFLINELNTRDGSVIIFVKTKHGADRLAEKLSKQNHHANAIHGDLKQRKRDMVIKDFRNLTKRILVATDVAARGLDIPHIKHVINYDLPQCPEDYIHRIGRTGRAGMEGFALSLVSPEDGNKWRRIHKLIETGEDDPSLADKPRSRRKPRQEFSRREDSRPRPPRREGERSEFSKRPKQREDFSSERSEFSKRPHRDRDFTPKHEDEKPWGAKRKKELAPRHEGERSEFSKRPKQRDDFGPKREDSKWTKRRDDFSPKREGERSEFSKRPKHERDFGPKREDSKWTKRRDDFPPKREGERVEFSKHPKRREDFAPKHEGGRPEFSKRTNRERDFSPKSAEFRGKSSKPKGGKPFSFKKGAPKRHDRPRAVGF